MSKQLFELRALAFIRHSSFDIRHSRPLPVAQRSERPSYKRPTRVRLPPGRVGVGQAFQPDPCETKVRLESLTYGTKVLVAASLALNQKGEGSSPSGPTAGMTKDEIRMSKE